MKNILTMAVCSFLFLFCLNGNAHENNSTKIAQIFEETIYLHDLEIDLQFLNGYKSSYPKLSEEEILDKMRLNKFTSIIWEQIYLKLSQEHNLEPTVKEVESLTDFLKSNSLNPAYTKTTPANEEYSLKIQNSFVKTYKVSKYLYETYGGTVIFQQGNPQEPVGAYRKLLEEYVAQNKFEIYAVKYKKAFWQSYLKEYSMVIPHDKVDFSKPWWESAKNK
jgi:hypothetical protein